MSRYVNSVTLRGNMGADGVKVHTFSDGSKVANFSVATSEFWTDKKTGEKRDKTTWHKVSVFNDKKIEYLERGAGRGVLVEATGKLATKKLKGRDGSEREYVYVEIGAYNGDVWLPNYRSVVGEVETQPAPATEIDDEIPF